MTMSDLVTAFTWLLFLLGFFVAWLAVLSLLWFAGRFLVKFLPRGW